ncbi:peptidoglycan DD-metalloendopeptidase family protein [bacterium]|nr:peptidoglycan DD-metalloendopeptidase family protein [bacterium]
MVYSLPFRGEWLVYNGGRTPRSSHSWDVLGQRFALDLVVADADLRRHAGRGTRPEQYFCHGRDILAAADGEVIAVEDRVRTAPLLGWGFCDITARSFVGNHVVIRHADEEFALYAHLIRGSLTVRPGDRVARGEIIGRCGHTGHSSEPHLHFHVQDTADLFEGMGRPVRFSALEVDGAPVDEAYLVAGNRVRPAPDASNEGDRS